MPDMVISTDFLKKSLQPYITPKNERRIKNNLWAFARILNTAPLIALHAKRLLSEGAIALQSKGYWLQLEIEARYLNKEDDMLFRRCLINFACALSTHDYQPSVIKINSIGIDLLIWYRISRKLGNEISEVLLKWERSSQLAPSSRLSGAQNALACLRKICEYSVDIETKIGNEGLRYFGDAAHYNLMFEKIDIGDRKKVLQSSLLAILAVYYPEQFKSHVIVLSNVQVDVTDLYYISPICVEQLTSVSTGSRFSGKKEHSLESIVRRFKSTVFAIKLVFNKHASEITVCNLGLDAFQVDGYILLKSAKDYLNSEQFNSVVLLLSDYWQRPVLKHQYLPNLLPFYFKKQEKYRTIDFSELAENSPKLFNDVCQIHQSEISLLPEKNYDITTLHTCFIILNRLLINFLIPEHKNAANKLGLACLSSNDNLIQKGLFQQIQAKVNNKEIARRTGGGYLGVIRWVMGLTGQEVIEAFGISMKRHQHHARRSRMEDLYTENELRELVFHVEKKLKIAKNNKQTVALYFARIQLKTCWNTSPLSDIELSDISEIDLPTEKKAIRVLTQKPRNGYEIDCYQLDGRSIRSVMHDIVHVRDAITKVFRKDDSKLVNKYLFIYQEKGEVKRLDPINISGYITSLLKGCGCSITYNSMRIRKNGANHIYREVAKNIRDYESCMRHEFSTFINNYQRINEVDTHKTLHDAVDVMQKYFTGREISSDIKILMVDDFSLQKTPTGECASSGNDNEFQQYRKEHKLLHQKNDNQSVWCSDYLACIWCKHFRTVADPEHVWQLLSYRDYVLADMSASVSNIDNNESQTSAITALHERVNLILAQLEAKSQIAVTQGKQLLSAQGMHPFWSFAITTTNSQGITL